MRPSTPVPVQINTDATLTSHEARRERITGVVTSAVEHVRDRISRVEVHLSVEHAHHPTGSNVRCLMEARIERHPPVAVSHTSGSLEDAVDGAADKLQRTLEHLLVRDDRRHRETIRHA